MPSGAPIRKKVLAARFVLFFVLWLGVAGWKAEDIPVGLVAASGALWVSWRLLPPHNAAPELVPLLALLGRFLRGSFLAGFDVARRALSPRLDLRPGFAPCPLTLPDGNALDVFCLYQSLQPGTLPTGVENGALVVHGLDLSWPIAETVAADEALFGKAIGDE
jgi:multicomponent Na+:H+ antiporter subunit E